MKVKNNKNLFAIFWTFSSHLFENVTIAGEWLQIWPKLGTHWAVMDFNVPHLSWHGASVHNGHLRGPGCDTHAYCHVFGSGAVLTT